MDEKVIRDWYLDKNVFDSLEKKDLIFGGMVVKETEKINKTKFVSACGRRGAEQIISECYSWKDGDERINHYSSEVFDQKNSYPEAYNRMDKFLTEAGL